MEIGTLLGILGIIVTLIIGIGAYFVVNSKSKNIVKKNKVKGDMVFGDKTHTNIKMFNNKGNNDDKHN